MYTYYVATRPETIVSLVNAGQMPAKLPSWMKANNITGFKDFVSSVSTSMTNNHQTFVLELALSDADLKQCICVEQNNRSSVTLAKIRADQIANIIVYSNRGQKLISRLFKGNCPKPIIVETEKYHNNHSTASSVISGDENQPLQLDMPVYRLSTREEHINLLRVSLKEATTCLLITSWRVDSQIFKEEGLYKLMLQAKKRGVKIYIYCDDDYAVDDALLDFFEEEEIFFAQTFTHSKILAVDEELVSVGSFNWLSGSNEQYDMSCEGSIVYEGELCGELIQELWAHIKHYRNEQYGNMRAVKKFERNPYNLCAKIINIGCDSSLTYLPTLDEHQLFLSDVFEKATRRIIICSPFISPVDGFKIDIHRDCMLKALERGVTIHFVCDIHNPNLLRFEYFLKSFQSTQVHLIKATYPFHLKTIIVDNTSIAEGSFNWLSAATDRESVYHNHEATFVIEGVAAKDLIESFFDSTIGQMVLTKKRKHLEASSQHQVFEQALCKKKKVTYSAESSSSSPSSSRFFRTDPCLTDKMDNVSNIRKDTVQSEEYSSSNTSELEDDGLQLDEISSKSDSDLDHADSDYSQTYIGL